MSEFREGSTRTNVKRMSPPPPPPLRNPNAGHDHSGVFLWVAVMMLCIAFGVLIGWKMHG